MDVVISWRLQDGCCKSKEVSGWVLLFPRLLWMGVVISWRWLDGCLYFLEVSGWTLNPGCPWLNAVNTQRMDADISSRSLYGCWNPVSKLSMSIRPPIFIGRLSMPHPLGGAISSVASYHSALAILW